MKKSKCEQALLATLSILAHEMNHSEPILFPITFALRRASQHVDLKYYHWQGLDLFEDFMNIIRGEITSL
jgi:hypothetical protein